MYKEIPWPCAIIFDWDNTLADSWAAITEANNLARSTFGLETWSVEETRVKSARALRVSYPEWFGGQWEMARDIFYKHYYQIHAQRVSPMKGAPELISWLGEQGIPLMVVSNKRGDLLRKEVETLGWTKSFASVIGATDAALDKPDPGVVTLALDRARLDVSRRHIWFVGDSHIDVECALRSGTFPILVHSGGDSDKVGVKLFFRDCLALRDALYNLSNNKNGL